MENFGSAAKKPTAEQMVDLDYNPSPVETFDGDAFFSQEIGDLPVPVENSMTAMSEGSPAVTESFTQVAANDSIYDSPAEAEVVSGDVLEGEWTEGIPQEKRSGSEDVEDAEIISENPATPEVQRENNETVEETEWSERLGELSGRFTGKVSNLFDSWEANREAKREQEALMKEYQMIFEYQIGPRLTILQEDPVYRIFREARAYETLDQVLLNGDYHDEDFMENDRDSLSWQMLSALFGTERSIDLMNTQAGVETSKASAAEALPAITDQSGERSAVLEGEYIPNGEKADGNEQLKLEHKLEPVALPEVVTNDVAVGGGIGEAYREGLLQLVDKSAEKAPGTAVTTANG